MGKTDKIIYYILIVGFIFLIYKYGYAPKNDSDKYISTYLKKLHPINVTIPDVDIPDYTISGNIYQRGFSIIGFKGLSGTIEKYSFYSSAYKKYFSIFTFDTAIDRLSTLANVLGGKDVLIDVNQDDLKNPNYGTKENPVPVFSFKGAKEPIEITSSDAKGNDIMKNVETPKEEFKHSVETYLTYIMPSKEFKERFEKN